MNLLFLIFNCCFYSLVNIKRKSVCCIFNSSSIASCRSVLGCSIEILEFSLLKVKIFFTFRAFSPVGYTFSKTVFLYKTSQICLTGVLSASFKSICSILLSLVTFLKIMRCNTNLTLPLLIFQVVFDRSILYQLESLK